MKIHQTEFSKGYADSQHVKVTLEHDEKYFTVNIPLDLFKKEEARDYGLNLVFGDGQHYE